MTQKELKNEYMEIIEREVWPGDPDMQKYEKNNTAYVVELSNGNLIDIEKPRIQKDFCFGYGFCGVSSMEEQKAAQDMEDYAATNDRYFFNENMKQVTEKIDDLKECLDGSCECYTYTHYTSQPDNSKLKDYSTTNLSHNPEYMPGFWSNYKDLQKLNADDIQRIIDGLKEVAKSFEKRLNTYLKKYGLSKVNTWSYLCD